MTRTRSLGAAILSSVCAFRELFYYLLVVELVLLLLSLFSLVYIDRAGGSFVILVVDLALLVPLVAMTVALIYACRSR